ncbi:hypothetical protein [Odoribacter lunatus]|uniref:hypothetical protein n=1 Tax=Odoribacter lunatus TaxID=2941335 RepID=UPI00203FDD48|nr:hypothetical protein [Odoribacter lunatus]
MNRKIITISTNNSSVFGIISAINCFLNLLYFFSDFPFQDFPLHLSDGTLMSVWKMLEF